MDDLSSKLAEILNDPEAMSRVKNMAENILGGNNSEEKSSPLDTNGLLNAGEMAGLISIVSRLKNSSDNPRSQLLNALKPHLSEPRREKVDTAIKILKIIEILPLMKDSGILNF